MSGGNRHQVRIYSSHRSEDSTRCGNTGGIGSFSKRNRHNKDFDYDKLASAVLSGLSSPRKKLPKLETAQVKDIRSILSGDGRFAKLFYSRPHPILCAAADMRETRLRWSMCSYFR